MGQVIFPGWLAPGDAVYMTATARPISPPELAPTITAWQQHGFLVLQDPELYCHHTSPVGELAGEDAIRATALQRALDHPEVQAIHFARGGYGTARLLAQLDWTGFFRHPKWLIGFSDLTILQLEAYRRGTGSVHGPLARPLPHPTAPEDLRQLIELLQGHPHTYSWQTTLAQQTGSVTAPLFAGNLALLCTALGTPQLPNLAGHILVLEETQEYLYRIDRHLNQLRRAGMLDSLAGLVIGDMTHTLPEEAFQETALHELIIQQLTGLSYPLAFGAPVGHRELKPLLNGGMYHLEVSDYSASLRFKVVNP